MTFTGEPHTGEGAHQKHYKKLYIHLVAAVIKCNKNQLDILFRHFTGLVDDPTMASEHRSN